MSETMPGSSDGTSYESADVIAEKFGGDILGEYGEGLQDIRDRISESRGKHLVVVSALKGVTDVLKEYLKTRDNSLVLTRVINTYAASGGKEGAFTPETVNPIFKNLYRLSDAEILGLGEVFSTELVCGYLKKSGIDAGKVNFFAMSRELPHGKIEANAEFPIRAKQFRESDADPDLEASRGSMKLARELLDKHDVVVTPGFVAQFRDNRAVTLGRGGSDTTLFIYAYGLGLKESVLWKAVPGIRSANPEIVRTHRLIKHLTPLEGLNLTLFGGDIVNYKAMQIAYDNQIGIRVPFIKNSKIFSVVGKRERGSVGDSSVKYVGGTNEAVLLHMGYDEAKNRVDRLVERNIGDFVHVYGPALNPTVAVLDLKKYNEIVDEEGWKAESRIRVAAIGIVGDSLGEIKGPLANAARVIKNAGIVIHGNVAATRKGTQGGYMAFFVDRDRFEKVVRLEHRLFIEKSN